MNRIYLVIIVLFISTLASGQQWNWAKDSGGNPYVSDSPGLCFAPTGELFACGTFNDSVTLGNKTYRVPTDSYSRGNYVAAFDAGGAVKWSDYIGGDNTVLQDIEADALGNVFVAGMFTGSLVLSNGTYFNNDLETFIISFNSTGAIRWMVRSIPRPGIHACDIEVDRDNNIYWTLEPGMNTGTTYAYKSTGKISNAGSVIWSKRYEGVQALKLRCSPTGDMYMSGHYIAPELTIDNTVFYHTDSSFRNGAYIAKIDANGTAVSAHALPNAFINSFGIDRNNNIYITGMFYHDMVVGDQYLKEDSCNYTCDQDFLAMVKPDGKCGWARKLRKVHRVGDMEVDENGNMYMAASCALDMDNVQLPQDTGRCGAMVILFGPDGIAKTGITNGGGYMADTWAEQVAIGTNGQVAISGTYHNNSVHSWFGDDTLQLTGYKSRWYIAQLTLEAPSNVNDPVEPAAAFRVAPNPSKGKFTITQHGSAEARLCVYDAMGSCVQSNMMTSTTHEIDLTGKAKGIYIVQLTRGQERTSAKVIVD